jgi:hypothetical protein
MLVTIIIWERELVVGIVGTVENWLSLFEKCCITNASDDTEGDYFMEQL